MLLDRPETSARAGRLSPESYHSQDGQASVLMDQAGERWSKVSESMSSSNGASLRSSISIRAADIFDRSLAWLDEELDSHSNDVMQSSSSKPGSNYSSSAVSASVGVKAYAHYSDKRTVKGKENPPVSRQTRAHPVGLQGNGAGRGREGAGERDRNRAQNRYGGEGSYTKYPAPSEAILKSGAFEDWEYEREKNGRRAP